MNFTAIRITFGIVALAALAIYDLIEKGRQATRWREYLFLALCTAVATVYGISNIPRASQLTACLRSELMQLFRF